MIKEHPVLSQVDSVLLQVWKIFKFSTVRNAILEEAQIVEGTKPLKMLKAVTTRWLTHGQAAVRVVERYKSIIAARDTIFFERGDCEVTTVTCDQLLKKHVMLMLLCIADLLKPINIFCKQLQLRVFQFTSVSSYVQTLISKLQTYKSECEGEDIILVQKSQCCEIEHQ